jgi:hypothetical protein
VQLLYRWNIALMVSSAIGVTMLPWWWDNPTMALLMFLISQGLARVILGVSEQCFFLISR